MSIDYLDGLGWAERWSREERQFCAVLYAHARNDPQDFARWVIDTAPVPFADASGDWDLGCEVCFYRDYFHVRKHADPSLLSAREGGYPYKRTFDLCLFGERAIIVIEAKVHEGFKTSQNDAFRQDIDYIRRAIGRERLPVFIVPLATGHYLESMRAPIDTLFTGRLTWAQVATYVEERYGRDPLLERANELYGT